MTIGLGMSAPVQAPDWKAVEAEALQTLQALRPRGTRRTRPAT